MRGRESSSEGIWRCLSPSWKWEYRFVGTPVAAQVSWEAKVSDNSLVLNIGNSRWSDRSRSMSSGGGEVGCRQKYSVPSRLSCVVEWPQLSPAGARSFMGIRERVRWSTTFLFMFPVSAASLSSFHSQATHKLPVSPYQSRTEIAKEKPEE